MSATLLGKCPGCKNAVRLSEDWAAQTVRCKKCGMISQSRPTAGYLARRSVVQAANVPVLAAPVVQAVPIVFPPAASVGENAWSAMDESAPVVIAPRYRKPGRGWVSVLVVLLFLGVCVGGTAAGVVIFGPRLKAWSERVSRSSEKGTAPAVGNGPNKATPVELPDVAGEFPRRMLGISVNNYVFANPTSYGTDSRGQIRRDFGQTLMKIGDKFRIPTRQVYELSDAAPGTRQKPPLKPIIEKTIQLFLESSRPQDRVILIICAHTVDIDGKPYLVPLEGELKDAKTLIPLAWLMEQLDRCPAQQKLLMADFNRFDRARGKERPNGGKLAARTEKMLKNPPKGVQVWSACSAGQYSYEFDEVAEFNGQAIKGGAFLSMFSVAFREGASGIQKPEDALPLEKLSKRVNSDTAAFSVGLDDGDDEEPAVEAKPEPKKDDMKPAVKDEKKPARKASKPAQLPFLAGEMKAEQIAYKQDEPAPKSFSIPSPGDVFAEGLATYDAIEALLDEIALPAMKPAKASDTRVRFDRVFPFLAETMKDYDDKVSIDAIKKNKDKYPLRAAVIDAAEVIRGLNASGTEMVLPDRISESDRTDAQKTNFARLQRGPARILQRLETVMEALQKAGDERKEEKSKRWQAHFDYVSAQVKARYVYIHEYTSAVGLIRKDNLPDLDKKKGHIGWKLAATERLLSTAEVKDMAKDANKLYAKLIKEHPKTPWEILAKRERLMALGLQWEAYGESNKKDDDSAMADGK